MATPTDLTPRVEALEGDDVTLQGVSSSLNARVTTLEASSTDLESRVTKLETDFADLQAKYDALNTRVQTLEANAGTVPTNAAPSDSSNTFTS